MRSHEGNWNRTLIPKAVVTDYSQSNPQIPTVSQRDEAKLIRFGQVSDKSIKASITSLVVYYESIKRELKIKPFYECR